MRIAVVGSGISGLGAAWALAKQHEVVVFEAAPRLGGHSNTVDVPTPEGLVAVDTGFIVYNEHTYPNLTRLFEALEVETEESDMSFAFSLERRFEYAGSLKGLLARRRQLVSRRYRRMIRDILRFRQTDLERMDDLGNLTLDDFLRREGFSEGFRDDYLLPMAAAIWSARMAEIRRFPASSMLQFLSNHGLIRITDRPQWRTVTGGSRQYVRKLAAAVAGAIRTSDPVTSVSRVPGGVMVESASGLHEFDHIVLACHTDQAMAILGDGATADEREVLKSIPYEANQAVLHSDPALMPQDRKVWASWNYMTSRDGREQRLASVTYWMNRLQNLDTSQPILVSLNPRVEPHPDLVHGEYSYAHPQFGEQARQAQSALSSIQGGGNVWFAGAWAGYGFHEDGLQSGLNVAAALGSPAPWHHQVQPMSSAPPIPEPSFA